MEQKEFVSTQWHRKLVLTILLESKVLNVELKR